jgi:hypothetical protein
MKIAPIAIVILLLAVSPLLAQTGGPALVFESATKEFGKVAEGTILKHVFKFTNKGSSTLEIFKVEPS